MEDPVAAMGRSSPVPQRERKGSGIGAKGSSRTEPGEIGALQGGDRAIVNGKLSAFAVQRLRIGDAWVMLPCIGTPALLQAMWSLPKARSASMTDCSSVTS